MTAYELAVIQLSIGRGVQLGADEIGAELADLYTNTQRTYVLIGLVIVGAFVYDMSRNKRS